MRNSNYSISLSYILYKRTHHMIKYALIPLPTELEGNIIDLSNIKVAVSYITRSLLNCEGRRR